MLTLRSFLHARGLSLPTADRPATTGRMRLLWYGIVALTVVVGAPGGTTRAGPPAGTDTLPVVATVDTVSLLGEDDLVLIGSARVERGPPREEAGVRIIDLEIVELELLGASRLGLVSVAERPNAGDAYVSLGEIRSLQQGADFPALAFVDLYLDVTAPASPIGEILLHNELPLRLAPRDRNLDVTLDAWPPLGVTFTLEPMFGVDNDGDGLVDEDTADDDGDGLIDEDGPGPDPGTLVLGTNCGDDADCDGRDGEDPPPELCDALVCDEDGDGSIDEDPSCVSLLSPENAHMKLGFCIRTLALDVAPELPSYSVARGGPSRLHPADILTLVPPEAAGAGRGVEIGGEDGSREAPFVGISCANLGLSSDGCDDGTDGDQDDVDALSFGDDLVPTDGREIRFSVGTGAQGARRSAVEAQRNCPPAQPGFSPEAESDEFGSFLDGTNYHVMDGNGPVGSCSPAFPLGLIEGATVRDDLDALQGDGRSVADLNADGVPERPVYFSLDAASPSLNGAGLLPADILITANGDPPGLFAAAAALGLVDGDDLDGLCLRDGGDAQYGPDDSLYFSLAPGSPTLSRIGAGPGDVLAPGLPPRVMQSHASIGLVAGDDVNALNCRILLEPALANGDVNCDGVVDSIDAALILQYDAGLTGVLVCAQNGDVNGNGALDSVDAALILQFTAGLLQRLPVASAAHGR